MIQSAERTALQIVDILRGGLGVPNTPQSLEVSLQQIRDLLSDMLAGEHDLSASTPATLDPALGALVGTENAASHGDHRHPLSNVATASGLAGAQGDITTLQSDVGALETSVGAVETAVAATDDRRITLGTEITHATKPTSSGLCCRWDAARANLFVGSLTGGGQSLRAYPFSGASPGVFSAPVVATTGTVSTNHLAVRPGGAHIATAHAASPWLRIYPWSGAAWGAAIDPAAPPAGAGAPTTVAWRPDGAFVALARNANAGNPEVIVFPFDGATIGAGITLASTGQHASGIAWSPDGLFLYVAWGSGATLRVTAHSFNGVTIGAAIEPASKPDNVLVDVAVSPDGNWIAIGTADSGNKIWAYPWAAGAFGTPVKLATPQPSRLAWAPDMAFLGLSIAASPFLGVVGFYPTGTPRFGFQTNFTLTGAPTGANDVHISDDGAYLAGAYDGTTRFGAFPGTRVFGF